MTEQIKELKKRLEKHIEEASSEKMIQVLTEINEVSITYSIIKETRIGKVVGKLRKHENPIIAERSVRIVDSWKKLVDQNQSSSSSTPNGQIKTTDNHEVKNESKIGEKRKEEKEEGGTKTKKSKSSSDYEDIRQQVQKLLLEALGDKGPDDSVEPDKLATEIEEALFQHFGSTNREYKAKYRSLSFNIKNPKNPELRCSLLQALVSPSKLVTMTAQEMASEELKKEREKIEKFYLEASKANAMNMTTTDMFQCTKCGKKETGYYQMQTRSADEPMTTFHTCYNCGKRWRS